MEKLKQERIKDYHKDMIDCSKNEDFENAHMMADDILIQIIRTELGCEFDDILDAYENVGKWYA